MAIDTRRFLRPLLLCAAAMMLLGFFAVPELERLVGQIPSQSLSPALLLWLNLAKAVVKVWYAVPLMALALYFMRKSQFSLRTLLIVVLLVGALGGLWWRWEPWALERTISGFAARSQDGQRILTYTSDTTAVISETLSGRELAKLEDLDSLEKLAFTADGLRVYTPQMGYAFRLTPSGQIAPWKIPLNVWDAQTGRKIETRKYTGVLVSRLSPDGKRIVLPPSVDEDADAPGILYDTIENIETGERIKLSEPGTPVEWSANGTRIAVRSIRSSRTAFLDTVTGKRVFAYWADSIHFSPQGRLVAAEHGSRLSVIDLDKRGEVAAFSPASMGIVEFSPDSRWGAVSGTDMSRTYVYDLTHQLGEMLFEGGFGSFSPDAREVVTFTPGSARIWDLKTGKPLAFPAQTKATSALYAGTDKLIFGDALGNMHIWSRRRSGSYWGILTLAEFWLAAVLSCALYWSTATDRRQLRVRSKPQIKTQSSSL
ncbi:MAG TPA: hypothetical protein VGP72_16820 [Planctomycetota bacterium]|jgi:hypothetical protein